MRKSIILLLAGLIAFCCAGFGVYELVYGKATNYWEYKGASAITQSQLDKVRDNVTIIGAGSEGSKEYYFVSYDFRAHSWHSFLHRVGQTTHWRYIIGWIVFLVLSATLCIAALWESLRHAARLSKYDYDRA
jgi:hypothetical protein